MLREGYVERLPELLGLESMELILFSMSLQCKRKDVTKEQLLLMQLIVNKNQLWTGKQFEILLFHLFLFFSRFHLSCVSCLVLSFSYFMPFFLPINLIIGAITKSVSYDDVNRMKIFLLSKNVRKRLNLWESDEEKETKRKRRRESDEEEEKDKLRSLKKEAKYWKRWKVKRRVTKQMI